MKAWSDRLTGYIAARKEGRGLITDVNIVTMNSIFSLYRKPKEAGRLIVGAMLEYLIKGWGIAGAANVVIGGGETFGQKAYEAASGIPGIIVNARRLWYALEH